MLKHFIIFFLVVIFNAQIFSQHSINQDSSKVDTTKIYSRLFNPFYNRNSFEPQFYFDNELNKWKIFIPLYGLKREFHIDSKYLPLNDVGRKSIYANSENLMESYNESIKILMALGYKDYTKYDLGELEKYLRISRDLMAIILGILSLLKK